MRLIIVRPLPRTLEGLDVRHLAFQGVYDVQAPLCDLLLATGYAIPQDDIVFEDRKVFREPLAVANDAAPKRKRIRKTRPHRAVPNET